MHKSIFFLLGFLIFCLFAIFGYLSASHEQDTNQPGFTVDPALPTPSQNNFLIIQIDSINSPTPQLISVWAVYNFKSTNQTVLTFSGVYPTSDPKAAPEDLASSFSINRDGNPDPSFFQKIHARGGPWQNYMMIDQQGSLKIREWLQESGVPIESPNPFDSNAILTGICQSINANGSQTPTKFFVNWGELAPFMKTNLGAKKIVETWKEINSIDKPAHCKILTIPSP